MTHSEAVTLRIPSELLEQLAELAAEIVVRQLKIGETNAESPYLTVPEAANYLRASKQRIYDLASSGRLTRHKDGRRVLISRVELDAHLAAGGRSPVAHPLPPARQRGTTTGRSE